MSKMGEILLPGEAVPVGHVEYSAAPETKPRQKAVKKKRPSVQGSEGLEGPLDQTARKQTGRDLVINPHPFRQEVHHVTVAEGATLLDMVEASSIARQFHGFVRVFIEDHEIEARYWSSIRPKPGRQVYIRVTPQGGRNILASLLMVVVSVAAAVFAPMIVGALFPTMGTVATAFATALVGAGISMLGAFLITALVPPPEVPGQEIGQRALLTGLRNRLQLYAPIPRVIGKRRMYPMMAASPYTEARGDKRWVRILLCVGHGPLKITDLKIGDTPITSFPNIKYEIREGWHADHAQFGSGALAADLPHKLFTQSVSEDNFNIYLDDATTPGPWATRTTDPLTQEASIDITAPYGLADFNNEGERNSLTLSCDVEWRLQGSAGAWTPVNWDGNDTVDGTQTNGKVILKDESADMVVRGGRWEFPAAGQYDVRVRRASPARGFRDADRLEWTALRSIKAQYPINEPGLCTIALYCKITDHFNGVPDIINCVAESYLPVWNGTSWAWALSDSPAWGATDILRRRIRKRMVPDSRLDLPTLLAWHTDAQSIPSGQGGGKLWSFNGIIEGGSIFNALKRITSQSRAAYILKDGKHSVVRDVQQATPVQHITPRNSWGYSGSKAFIDLPHALRVQFINAANGYQDDEVVVYADGYSAANADRFEVLELPDCVSQAQAWREARYHMAVAKLRPDEHKVSMDIEHLRFTLGDRVQFAHDVVSIGIASGRIKSRILDGSGNLTGFNLDETVPRITGTGYALRVRAASGVLTLYPLAAGTTADVTAVTLASPIAAASIAGHGNAGDLFTYGISGTETAPMIVKKIEGGPDFSAQITLVDYNDAIYTADTGAIPAYDSHVTEDTPAYQRRPSPPIIRLHSGDEAAYRKADGTWQERLAVALSLPAASTTIPVGFEVQYRRVGDVDGENAWKHAPGSPGAADARTYFADDVLTGQIFDVRARILGEAGLNSDWAQANDHTIEGRTTAPQQTIVASSTGLVRAILVAWTTVTSPDLARYELYVSSLSTAPTGATAATHWTDSTTFTITNLPDAAQRYVWVRARNRAGVAGAWHSAGNATTLANLGVTSSILTGLVNAAAFASGIRPVEIVSALPASGNFQGRTVFLTTDNKLYRHNGVGTDATGFTKAVDGADIVAGSILAGKIAAGAISTAELAAGAVIASKMLVADMENLQPVTEFEEATAGLFTATDLTLGWTSAANAQSGQRAALLTKSTGAGLGAPAFHPVPATFAFNVVPGETYWIEAVMMQDSGAALLSAADIGLSLRTETGAFVAEALSGLSWQNLGTTFTTLTAKILVPNTATIKRAVGMVKLNPALASGVAIRLDRIKVRRANAGALIVDGTISATAVNAEFMAAISISAEQINGGTITADLINIDRTLQFGDGGALAVGKTSAADSADGVWLGNPEGPGGFAFTASRGAGTGDEQSITITEDVVELVNPDIFVGSTVRTVNSYSVPSTTPVTINLTGTQDVVDVSAYGGGGAGGNSQDSRSSTRQQAGTASIVKLKGLDGLGAPVEFVFTAAGGLGGRNGYGGSPVIGYSGQSSAIGTGGTGGYRSYNGTIYSYTYPTNATGFSAGGGGGIEAGDQYGGEGGAKGGVVALRDWSFSAHGIVSGKQIEITQVGDKGLRSGTGEVDGSSGSGGYVSVSIVEKELVPFNLITAANSDFLLLEEWEPTAVTSKDFAWDNWDDVLIELDNVFHNNAAAGLWRMRLMASGVESANTYAFAGYAGATYFQPSQTGTFATGVNRTFTGFVIFENLRKYGLNKSLRGVFTLRNDAGVVANTYGILNGSLTDQQSGLDGCRMSWSGAGQTFAAGKGMVRIYGRNKVTADGQPGLRPYGIF